MTELHRTDTNHVPTTATRPWRLGRRTRKAVLVTHIVSVGAWIGMDVVLAILVFTAMFTSDPHTLGVSYQALSLFAVWPLFIAGFICLLSGVALGLGTKYGLIRYWWVAVKLVLNLLLTGLVLIALRPTVIQANEQGAELINGTRTTAPVTDLIYPPIVSPLALLFAVIIAVYKPWGRTRKNKTDTRRATSSPTES
ncbi:hypothetical protein [Sciscionella marina]|uniref:hypothetical protein n=1 Tax=Sciscionella marina TaxID=508770 RepID=UPI00037473E7|nr:hypothetical protein [Sciscionella marina]